MTTVRILGAKIDKYALASFFGAVAIVGSIALMLRGPVLNEAELESSFSFGQQIEHRYSGQTMTFLEINCQLKNQIRGSCAIKARSNKYMTIGYYHPSEIYP